ncbi:MBL fold metallo-hydrolase [Microbacterium sp. NPDC058345]|uniref:MBL fold metallo-hydrolase n=1 Tax=Microbacterium sp. NPDC058345 TaxID=3346455 RepID=UPI00364F14FE
MSVATIEVLLPGRALTTPEGSVGFCGTYLVTCAGPRPQRILFDPGHAGRRSALLSQLAKGGLDAADIDTVVLSHAHWDHAQNADLFERATVWAHAAELDGPTDRRPRDIATPAWTFRMLRFVGATAAVDGQALGTGVDVLHVPGHTAGSIGLRVRTAAGVAVLSGDAISRRDAAQKGRCAVAHFDAAAGMRSVQIILRTADEVWPGHDRPFAVRNGLVGEYLSPADEVEIVDRALER